MTDWVTLFEHGGSAAELRPLGTDTWEIRWSNPKTQELEEALASWLAGRGNVRLVHLGPVGDYKDLRAARTLGFRAEGSEIHPGPEGPEVFWRSARLGNQTVSELAELIDGSRPSHLVDEFHEVYDLPSNVSADFKPSVDFPRLGLRMSLIKEEFAELCGAVYGPKSEAMLLDVFEKLPDETLRDPVEAADALGDLVYVIYGMALESGIDLDRVLSEVHRSNLSKLMPDGSVRRRPDGKVLKGPDFSEPDIAGAMQGR